MFALKDSWEMIAPYLYVRRFVSMAIVLCLISARVKKVGVGIIARSLFVHKNATTLDFVQHRTLALVYSGKINGVTAVMSQSIRHPMVVRN